MSKRVFVVALAAVIVAAFAAYILRPGEEPLVPEGAPTETEMAQSIGTDVMRSLYRGHVAGRSGEIMLVPKPQNFLIGEWPLETLGTEEPDLSTSHPNPWAYLARVPILLVGDGVPRAQDVRRSIDIASLAPTYARVLGMDDFESEAPVLDEGLPSKTPKVIFTVVIDGGGWNALQEHPDSWPTIARLRREGTTYVNATIGSAPSITGALHATFGTGRYPIDHGIPGNQMRGPDGANTDAWLDNADPRYLESPTVTELWDEANGNEPIVATVSYEGWHLGMIGHGAQRDGGDKDIAVLWDNETNEWWTNESYYDLPSYLEETDQARFDRYEEELDPRDGLVDGTWFGNTLEDIRAYSNPEDPNSAQLVRPATPAFVRLTGDAVVDVLRHEPWGADGPTDMFWVEMKMPDYAGHQFNVTQPEEADVIREVDHQIGRFIDELDRKVGRGNYLFALSADHGQQPLPDLRGGWRINADELERDIESRFGNILEKATPVDIYFDAGGLEREGVALSDVARYLATYTIGDNIPPGAPGSDRVPPARLGETLFAGAFTTEFLQSLTPEQLQSFGVGEFGRDGDLTSPPGVERTFIP